MTILDSGLFFGATLYLTQLKHWLLN